MRFTKELNRKRACNDKIMTIVEQSKRSIVLREVYIRMGGL